MVFPLTGRSLTKNTTLPLLAAVFAFVILSGPQVADATPPACTEYCYEPIPVPGTEPGPSAPEPAPDEPGNGVGSTESAQTPQASQVIAETPSGAETSPRIVASKRDARSNVSKQREDELAEALAQTGSPAASETEAVSVTWLALAVLVLIATIAMLVVGTRRIRSDGLSSSDALIRVIALIVGLVAVYLISPGISGASAASAPRSFFGMTSIELITEADAAKMKAGGVSTYRFPMSWDLVQTDPASELDWGFMDISVAASASAGLRVLPIMAATPKGFADKYTELPIRTNAQRQGWANFLRSAIRRYGPKGEFWKENPGLPKLPVRTWQVWNEANFFYFTEPVVSADYLKLLKASHRIIKAEDPGAKVMLSGLFGSPPNDPLRSIKSWQFLAQLYKKGAKPYFDSVAIHPYSPDTTQLRLIIEKIRSTMNRYGGKKTPIDVTEIGWGSDSRTIFGMRTVQGQAKQLTSGYRYLINNRKKMGIRSAYWFAWKDLPETFVSCNQCYFSGLFYSGTGLSPKPAWNAFVKLTGGQRN